MNRTISAWRENLADYPSLRAENLDEMESHLRDSIATLQARGLPVEEAFLIATRRIGSSGALENEFAKVNRRAVWAAIVCAAPVAAALPADTRTD